MRRYVRKRRALVRARTRLVIDSTPSYFLIHFAGSVSYLVNSLARSGQT